MATILVLPEVEVFVPASQIASFEVFQSELFRDFAPRSEFEIQCVRTIAHSLWTIRRTRILERRMQERAMLEGFIDPLLDLGWAGQLRGILNLRRQAERSQQLALRDFKSFRAAVDAPKDPDPESMAAAAAAAGSGAGNLLHMPPPMKKAASPAVETGLPPLQDCDLLDRDLDRVGRHSAGGHHHRLIA